MKKNKKTGAVKDSRLNNKRASRRVSQAEKHKQIAAKLRRAAKRFAVDLSRLPENYVITPGGPRHISRIHTYIRGVGIIKGGHILPRPHPAARRPIRPLEIPASSGNIANGGQWQAFAYWKNESGSTITQLKTTWQVPQPPQNPSNQVIYLFNGLQTADRNTIVQPVLQWGHADYDDPGDIGWALRAWVILPDAAIKSSRVPVKAGDTVTGVVAQTSAGDGTFNYTCYFEGKDDTENSPQSGAELVMPVQTLETYNASQRADFPSSSMTAMTNIVITFAADPPLWAWHSQDSPIDDGPSVTVFNNTEVDISYTGA